MPSELHEDMVDTLRAIATSFGYYRCGSSSFPFRERPDVVRFGQWPHGIFVADAKASEGPSDQEVLRRLRAYMCWFAALRVLGRVDVFALCHGRLHHHEAWTRTLSGLALEFRVRAACSEVTLARGLYCCLVVSGAVPSRARS